MPGFAALGELALAEPPSGPDVTLAPPVLTKQIPVAVVEQT